MSDEDLHVYRSLSEAALGLLGDVTRVVSTTSHRFTIIGGWSPYLRNSSPIKHPGTKDVDVLFEEGADVGALESVVHALLREGYCPSAKHEFQLLRVLRVLDREFVFNVDLLHPLEGALGDASLVDHLELPVPISSEDNSLYVAKSIAVPSAAFILEDERFSMWSIECTLPAGSRTRVDIPLVDELGLIVTKSKSIHSPKRPRDALDVYLAVVQSADYGTLVRDFRNLSEHRPDVFGCLDGIRDFLGAPGDERFDELVESQIAPGDRRGEVTQGDESYGARISDFLREVGL